MSIMKYRAFVRAVECGCLTSTANQLNYTQPGISHMISALERELGVTLLFRSKSGVTPTEDGKRVYEAALRLVQAEDHLRNTIDQINGLVTGTIRLSGYFSVMTKWIPNFVTVFSSKYPQIELQLFEGEYDEQVTMLKNQQVDVSILSSQAPRGYTFIPLHLDPAVVLVPLNHELAHRETIRSTDLLSYPMIVQHHSSAEELFHVFNSREWDINRKCVVKSDTTIIALVQRGLGIGLTSSLLVTPPPPDVKIFSLEKPYARTLGIALSPKNQDIPAIKCLLDEFCALFQDEQFSHIV